MTSIGELTEATILMKQRSDRSVGWPLAAIKAIEGRGIRHKPDVQRLKKRILDALRVQGIIPSRKRRAYA